ncbi:MAG TPA: Mpo1-like protein [Phycisphaerae bacterium]|nr:Mpo1-like protein [Phycisphaerae bacterium]
MSESMARRKLPGWLAGWLARHRNPVSFWLHMVGIPMTLVAVVLAIVQLARGEWGLWWRPAVLFFGGYFLQWVGHVIEGNDMGELILIKKLRGKPYVAISPRYASK